MIKLNYKILPKATQGKLLYGLGNVFFETNGEVVAIKIKYRGAIRGWKKLGKGWRIRVNHNTILIYSRGESELKEFLFSYVGELAVTGCTFITWDEKQYQAKTESLAKGMWKDLTTHWEDLYTKWEEIKQQKVIRRTVKKSIF